MEFFTTINSVYVFVGASLLGACGGLLGSFAVLRRQGLLGDALAHSALPGIAVAFLVMQTKFLPGLLLGALISGLIGSGLIYFLVYFSRIKMESAMAAVLSVFFGLGIVFLTYIQRLSIASQSGLETFLFGQAAALLKDEVWFIGIIFAVVLVLILIFFKELKLAIFDRGFARSVGIRVRLLDLVFMTAFIMAILISLQTVGVILTAGIFITPAAAALLLSKRMWLCSLLATIFGALAGGSGALLSASYGNLPTGPVIVLLTSFIFVLAFLFAPKKGLIGKWWAHRRFKVKVVMENALGKLARACARGEHKLASSLFDRKVVALLRFNGLVDLEDGMLSLTVKGKKRGVEVVEKHRLWESYLVNRFNLPDDHVHRDAEDMEHILTDDLVMELKKLMKDPQLDPHGQPIKLKL